jgi:hypothetical protein
VPGDDAALGRDGFEHLGHEVAGHLQVDEVVAAGSVEKAALAALGGALEGASLGAAAQGVEGLAREDPAHQPGVEIADEVGAHLHPVGIGQPVQLPGGRRRQSRDKGGLLQTKTSFRTRKEAARLRMLAGSSRAGGAGTDPAQLTA